MLVKLNVLGVLLFICLFINKPVIAQTSGQALFIQCAACHGASGEGNDALNAPAVAGQEASYVIRQLTHYAKNIRAKAELAQPMVAIAKGISSSEDIKTLATYIEKLPIKKFDNEVSGDLMNGSRYYQAKCGACHGGQAEGNKSFNAPRLANQSSKYLLQQMQDFVAGKRGYDQNDKFGRQMAMMANTTKDQELSDILFYIAQQNVNP